MLKLVYIANIIVAGWIGITALFSPKLAAASVFSNIYPSNESMRIIGALWLGIAVLSAFGIWKPVTFSPILMLQLFYKGGWLLIVALPALINGESFPREMTIFFIVWVVVLPFVIPWKEIFV